MRVKMIFIVLMVLFSSAITDDIDPSYNYDRFMAQYDRKYLGQEKIDHEQIFNANYADLLQRIRNGEDVVVNDFLDWNQTQKESFFNYKPQNLNVPLSSRPARLSAGLFANPKTFDWRTLGRVTPVKNQGSCGSCWAFSSTAQYQSAVAIQTNGTLYDLAEQYAVECEKNSFGCKGGYPYQALKLFNSTGIPLESTYPYKANTSYYTLNNVSICSATSPENIKLKSSVPIIQHYTNLTTEQIELDLITYGPMSVAVFASQTPFMSVGKTGLIDNCATKSIDHAVLLVGYNSTHWFIKNSWGTGWGDKGFAYILKVNDCNLHSWVDALQVNYPNPIVSPNTVTNTTVNTTTLTIKLADSKGDGWNGNVLALKQNGIQIATFGSTFTSGSTFGPITVTVPKQVSTQIVVAQLGNKTNQTSFSIYSQQGTLLFSRPAGTNFTSTIIFATICPTFGCTVNSVLTYYVTLSSTGTGWYGNDLAFRQNGSIVQTFGSSNFTYINSFGQFMVNFTNGVNVDIIVSKLGTYTQRIGFTVRTYNGFVLFKRQFGSTFTSNSLLGTFAPDGLNLSPVSDVTGNQEIQKQPIEDQETKNKKIIIGFIVSTSILVAIVLSLSAGLACTVLKLKKISKQNIRHNITVEQSRVQIKSCDQATAANHIIH